MVKSSVLLAAFAAVALAAPTTPVADVEIVDKRTIGLLNLLGDVLGTVKTSGSVAVGSSTNVKLSKGAASALSACAAGASVGSVSVSAKAELYTWINSASISASTKTMVQAWLKGSAGASSLLSLSTDLSIGGDLVAYLNTLVLGSTSVSAGVSLDLVAQAALASWLSVSANVNIDADVLSALKISANGGVVAVLDASVKVKLNSWLNSSNCGLSTGLKASVSAWVSGTAIGSLDAASTGMSDVLFPNISS